MIYLVIENNNTNSRRVRSNDSQTTERPIEMKMNTKTCAFCSKPATYRYEYKENEIDKEYKSAIGICQRCYDILLKVNYKKFKAYHLS